MGGKVGCAQPAWFFRNACTLFCLKFSSGCSSIISNDNAQQPLGLQLGEVFGDDLEQGFGHRLAGFQVAPVADLEGHVDEGVVMLAVGHAPGVQAHSATADAPQGKHAAVPQHGVNLLEQGRQVGLLLDVVGVFGDEVRHVYLLLG